MDDALGASKIVPVMRMLEQGPQGFSQPIAPPGRILGLGNEILPNFNQGIRKPVGKRVAVNHIAGKSAMIGFIIAHDEVVIGP